MRDTTMSWVNHALIESAKNLWKENGILSLTALADVYDDDYTLISTNQNVSRWEHRPVIGVGKILKLLEDDSEFQVLCKEQPNVGTAFGDFEAVVKLHENL
jgi:hypothetical protein